MGQRVKGATPAFGGDWTEQKLQILEAYLNAYTTALKSTPFGLVYIDAFAGSGKISRGTSGADRTDERDSRSFIEGSAGRALRVGDRSFDRLVFVEKDPGRCAALRRLRDRHADRTIDIIEEDANCFLTGLRRFEYGNWRGVLFVDPFGVQLKWAAVEHIAGLRRLDMWLLFPVGAIGRMLPLSRNPDDVDPSWVKRLNIVFGGNDWRKLYSHHLQGTLFGDTITSSQRVPGVHRLLTIYKDQLKELFGSRFLRKSRTLRNSKNAPLFEFIFCAGHPKGARIAKDIARHLIEKM